VDLCILLFGGFMELTITANLTIDDDMVYEESEVIKELTDSFLKIKSGLYENIAFGYVTSVQTIPSKDLKNQDL
jgi:hypothetical protein